MQPIIFLLFLTGILVGTVQSTPQMQGTPQMLSEEDPSSDVINGSLAVVDENLSSASNGSSLEDILKELHLESRTKRRVACHFSAGAFGGGGGRAFDELPNDCRAIVSKIVIRSGSLVDGIQITYRLSNGRHFIAGHHGGRGGAQHVINININGGERIIGIFGKSAALVDQLGFVTNRGRIFGPYGGCGGNNFRVSSCHLRGIFGRSAALIDSIGFHCSRA